MFSKLIDAFRAPNFPKSLTKDERRERTRRLVMRTASGNVRIQRGQYATREDLDKQFERVTAESFDE